MFCEKCGTEIKEGENFCGNCGKKIINKAKTNNKKFIFKILIILSIIIVLIILGNMLKSFKIEDGTQDSDSSVINLPEIKTVKKEEIINILKNSDNGIYLQEDSVILGSIIDLEYGEYNKIISYSCRYINGSVSLNLGGLLLYNIETEKYKSINVDGNFLPIIYYLNTEGESEKLESLTRLAGEYLKENALEELNILYDLEKYMDLGKRVGAEVGVELCRDLVTKSINESISSNMVGNSVFYKQDEIFPRYVGCETTKQVYVWSVVDESMAQYLYANNRSSYNNLVYVYGEPYMTVTNFSVFDFTKDSIPLVGEYKDKQDAMSRLQVVE